MSDFEFEGEIVNHEEDPAAEFIAREQDELAGLDDDTLGLGESAASTVPDSFQNGTFGSHNNIDSEHMNGPSESYPVAPSRSVAREEPEKIKKWREEQQKMLEVKDAEEEEKKKELQETAKKEMEDWYARYKDQIEKSKLNNRTAEKEWIADRDAESTGLEWERVAKLCDFNPKSSRSTKDTSRMRSIILQLKQTPVPARKS